MSSVPVVRDQRMHLKRAIEHAEAGDRLKAVDDEWFAVCYFYSAYHMVKAAMQTDPIFDDAARCQAVDLRLTRESRYAEHHSGGAGVNGRTLGVNEIVFKLYHRIRVPYTRLHSASVSVRYGAGLEAISPITVADDFNAVRKAYLADEIVAP